MKSLAIYFAVMFSILSNAVYADMGAQAKLVDVDGNHVGVANFKEKSGGGVTMEINAHNLAAGDHGMHIHTIGSCTLGTTPAFSSAGGHFNPAGAQHGTANPAGPHAGDLPNLAVKDNGNVATTVTSDRFTLQAGQSNSLFDADGSAIVIHEKADDNMTNPTGNSGNRVACGVIEKKGN